MEGGNMKELTSEELCDVFHDTRRSMLNELEKLFDLIDGSYASTDYYHEKLEEGIKELQYALSLVKNIDL